MPTRREIEQQRIALKSKLRKMCRDGSLKSGTLMPPVRQLAEEHQVSSYIVHQTLQGLIQEGVLYTVPRVGTFVGQPLAAASELYLLLLGRQTSPTDQRIVQFQMGFESRVAQQGGAVLLLDIDTALAHRRAGDLPVLAGVFDLAFQPHGGESWAKSCPECTAPRARFHTFHNEMEDGLAYDTVSFDDRDGGRQATRHLLERGHQQIAFLALHSLRHDTGRLIWSAEREAGWLEVMEEAGFNGDTLAFHPATDAPGGDLSDMDVALKIAHPILHRHEVTAVVAANDYAALGLLKALQAARVPREHWPALVGFDNHAAAAKRLVTSLRLPWEELGGAAADLLWERRHGQLCGPPVQRQVAMRLIPRLTSRTDWPLNASHAALATAAV